MSALAVSQIQKHFITNQIYKRSKRYFDVLKLKSIEQHNSKSRRKPNNYDPKQQLQRKIEMSFLSSEQYYYKRRIEEIQKSKKKSNNCSYDFDDKDQIQTNISVVTKNISDIKAKGFDMGKALSRQFYENLQTHAQTSVEDPFDNFVVSDFSKGQKGRSIDFNKIMGRKDTLSKHILTIKKRNFQQQQNPEKLLSLNSDEINQRNYTTDVGKTYQKIVFDQSKFKCLIDVQKQKKALHRKSLQTTYNFQSKQLNLQKIQRGREFSIKKPVPSSLMFYYGKGKQQPSQIHYRLLKKNENYWLEQVRSMKKQKQDFETVKRRSEMIQKRKEENRQKKNVVDQRGEICDAKFFLRRNCKQNQ